MSRQSIDFHDIYFCYDTASRPLFEKLNMTLPAGWTGIVGANGVGKTTFLRLATGQLKPQKGAVEFPKPALYCPQRTDHAPPQFSDLMNSLEGEAIKLIAELHLDPGWIERWESLSHGERKRAQIAVALWLDPVVLAVDEPTNHIDADARKLLKEALRGFRGVGLLVSHDRELLDELCCQCLFIDPPEAVMRSGGVTMGMEQEKLELESFRKEYETARQEYARLKREASKRRNLAAQQQRRRSKRGLDPKDHDARFKKNLARVTGKDGVGGRLLRQMNGRLNKARERQEAVNVKKNYDLGIWLPGSISRQDNLFRLDPISLPLGAAHSLAVPELEMKQADRIALTGPNGSGKSTFVRHIIGILKLPPGKTVYIPQEIDLASSLQIMKRVRELPKDQLGHTMAGVSRLGSRPERLLETSEPSPGEMRKILLAMGIAHVPHLIIMDEPTNHMDLPSIECLEEALEDCPCGLLLVSHDQRFLDRLTTRHWIISGNKDRNRSFWLQTD